MKTATRKTQASWVATTVGEVVDISTGGTPNTQHKEYWNGDIPWMSSGEVNLRRVRDTEKRITKLGLDNCNSAVFPKGTVMLALAGQGSTRGKVAMLEIESACNQSLAALHSKNESQLLNAYIFYNLESRYAELRNINSNAGRAGLNLALIRRIPIKFPQLDAQRKITDLLFAVDQEVAAIDEIVQATEKLKRGLMEKFLERGKEWPMLNLGDIAHITRGGSPRPIEDFITDDSDGLNWLRIGDIKSGAKYITHTSQKIKKSGLSKTTLIHPGDFILSNSMSFGRPYIMQTDACIHDGWLAFKNIKADLVDAEFLYYLLSSRHMQKAFWGIAAGSGVKNLKRESVSNLTIALPPIKEQKNIAKILSALDAKLTTNREIKAQLLKLKKGLTSDLFSSKRTAI